MLGFARCKQLKSTCLLACFWLDPGKEPWGAGLTSLKQTLNWSGVTPRPRLICSTGLCGSSLMTPPWPPWGGLCMPGCIPCCGIIGGGIWAKAELENTAVTNKVFRYLFIDCSLYIFIRSLDNKKCQLVRDWLAFVLQLTHIYGHLALKHHLGCASACVIGANRITASTCNRETCIACLISSRCATGY